MWTKLVPALCTEQAEEPILDETGLSLAHFYFKAWIHLLPSTFTRIQFCAEMVCKSQAVSPLIDSYVLQLSKGKDFVPRKALIKSD